MLTKSLLVAAALLTGLTGCATSGTQAVPHQHMRDAKQGTTYPAPIEGEVVRKPLHDHREMK